MYTINLFSHTNMSGCTTLTQQCNVKVKSLSKGLCYFSHDTHNTASLVNTVNLKLHTTPPMFPKKTTHSKTP